MCGGGKDDKKGLGERGLVDLAGEEKVGFGGGNRAGGKGNQRGCSQVKRREERESIRGVSLDACYWAMLAIHRSARMKGLFRRARRPTVEDGPVTAPAQADAGRGGRRLEQGRSHWRGLARALGIRGVVDDGILGDGGRIQLDQRDGRDERPYRQSAMVHGV